MSALWVLSFSEWVDAFGVTENGTRCLTACDYSVRYRRYLTGIL